MMRTLRRVGLLGLGLAVAGLALWGCGGESAALHEQAQLALEAFGPADNDRDAAARALLAGQLAVEAAREAGEGQDPVCRVVAERVAKLEAATGAKATIDAAALRAAFADNPRFDSDGALATSSLELSGLAHATTLAAENCWTRLTR